MELFLPSTVYQDRNNKGVVSVVTRYVVSLALVFILVLSAVASAAEDRGSAPLEPEKNEREYQTDAMFSAITATVKKVSPYAAIEQALLVSVETVAGNPANIVVSPDTYIIGQRELAEGDKITFYYDTTKPMILIYPPQYAPEVVVVGEMDFNLKVDAFDKELVSYDKMLKLNISPDTEIIGVDGTVFEGSLGGRKLAVLYQAATKSIPAHTVPLKVVVLPEPEKPAADRNEDNGVSSIIDFAALDVIVENQKIKAPAPYTNENNVVMVPLRAISEALGYDVSWNEEKNCVVLDNSVSFTPGVDNYKTFKAQLVKLGAAPELKDSRTFVPLAFFREVLGLNNAYLLEGQIVIDDGELMN